MDTASKSFSLLLVVSIIVLSLLIVQPASSQSILKPSVPEFTVQFVVDTSYIAPTYTINPYNGQNQTVGGGYTQETQTIEFTVKNQPFTTYKDSNGSYIGLYYNFRYKGHYGNQWNYYPFYLFTNNATGYSQIQTTHSYGPYSGGLFVAYSASSSEYTVISIRLSALTIGGYQGIPDNSVVDFQTQAQIGHIDDIPSGLLAGDFYSFTGESSDWSNTQTITLGEASTSTNSPNPTPTPTLTPTLTPTTAPTATPTIPEFPSWASLLLLTSMVVAAGLLVYFKKRKR